MINIEKNREYMKRNRKKIIEKRANEKKNIEDREKRKQAEKEG